MSNKPNWMDVEEGRAVELIQTGETNNAHAPKLTRIVKAPVRKQKAFYIQPKHAEAFEDFVLMQKRSGGKKATELAEEMISDLLTKYGFDISAL